MCPRGEIGRHKGLKTPGIQQDFLLSLLVSHSLGILDLN